MYNYILDPILKDSELKYYLLGLIASDGYISTRYNRIELTLKESDLALLESIRDVLCPGKKISYKAKQRAYRLILDNKNLHREICRYINPKNKTFSLIFPYGLPDKYIRHFIRGYIDGDGTIGVKRGQRKVDNETKFYYGLRLRVLGTRAFLRGFSENIHRVLGINRVKVHRKAGENIFYIEYAFRSAEKVLNWVYQDCTFKLDRKYRTFLKISNEDSDTLAKNYGKVEGCYNMQRPVNTGKE